jgi:hypothetical protein
MTKSQSNGEARDETNSRRELDRAQRAYLALLRRELAKRERRYKAAVRRDRRESKRPG